MSKKMKINPSQLFCIILLMRLFTLMSSSYEFSADTICGAFISVFFQFLLLLPIFYLFKFNKNFLTSKVFMFLISLFLILITAEAMCRFWNTSSSIKFPIGHEYVAIGMIALVCIYGCHIGLKAMGRASVLIFGMSVLALVLLCLGAISKIKFSHFMPITTYGNVFDRALRDFSDSVELIPLFVLLTMTTTEKSPFNAAKFFLNAKLIIILVINFIGITVLGSLMSITDKPFFAIGAYSHPLGLQRTDAVYITLFTLICILFVSVNLFLTSMLLGEIFPKLVHSKFLSVVLVILAIVFLNNVNAHLETLKGVGMFVILALAPLTMYERRQPNEKDNISVNNAPVSDSLQ